MGFALHLTNVVIGPDRLVAKVFSPRVEIVFARNHSPCSGGNNKLQRSVVNVGYIVRFLAQDVAEGELK
jgi:hypothetical protein